jgi:hypothetical protein
LRVLRKILEVSKVKNNMFQEKMRKKQNQGYSDVGAGIGMLSGRV